MKPTIKVSIGGFGFNLEEDAYQSINDYLIRLNKHFEKSEEGAEIVSDIELRMAELFRMRLTDRNGIVSLNDVNEILQIMGNPKDFHDKEDSDTDSATKPLSTASSVKPAANVKRKLYRDPERGIIGGVCSGLGHFFRIDPVIIRLVLVVLLLSPTIVSRFTDFSFQFFHDNSFLKFNMSIILLYIILWLVMPKAKTLAQKIAMKGTNPSIENVESRADIPQRKTGPSTASNIVKIIFSIILGFISVIILASIIGVVAMFFGVYINSDYLLFGDILEFVNIDSVEFKISVLLVMILPLAGLLYICLKFLFNSRFSLRDGIISLVAFIVWVGAISYVGGKAFKLGRLHNAKAVVTDVNYIETESDTLYIEIPQEYNLLTELDGLDVKSFRKNNKDGVLSLYFLPSVKVRTDTLAAPIKIEMEKTAYDESPKKARKKAEKYKPQYSVTDSLLTLHPQVYNRKSPWNREFYRMTITVPEGKTVLLDTYLKENKTFFINIDD